MSGCCAPAPEVVPRTLAVELLFLDRDVCTRCRGADDALDAAVAAAAPALRTLGVTVEARRVLVESEATAERVRLVTSPTIRIDGRDIAPVAESLCESCGDLMTSGAVDCRVWTWRGAEFTAPPEGLIVEALLRAALAPPPGPPEGAEGFALPENLRQFFRHRAPGCGCS